MRFVSIAFIFSYLATIINALFASKIISSHGSFPYQGILSEYHLPHFISVFANFDGVHYMRIAQYGYINYEQAFFPLYPFLIYIAKPIFFNNALLAGLIISLISFLGGLYFFYSYAKLTGFTKYQIRWFVVFFLAFPTSFFFYGVYTEALFFFIVILSLFLLQKRLFFLAAVTTAFSSFSRLQGIFLAIPFVFALLQSAIYQKYKYVSYILAMSSGVGILVYSLYLHIRFADPFLYYHAQQFFGANRTTTHIVFLPQIFYRYMRIAMTRDFTITYFVALFELLVFSFVFTILLLDLYGVLKHKREKYFLHKLSLNLFSLCMLIFPTLTGTFSSVPRYSLLSLAFFIWLSQIQNNVYKSILLIIFIAIRIIVFSLFAQGYFVS